MHEINNINKPLRTLKHFSNYFLIALIILVLTGVIILAARGYDFDRSTGQVIQNGILLVETQPEGANVSLNGISESARTPAKYPIPQGVYDLSIEHPGYRVWRSRVEVVGSQVNWIYYPKLVPRVINTSSIAQVNNLQFIGHNTARDTLITSPATNIRSLRLYDIGANTVNAQPISIPESVFARDGETIKGSTDYIGSSEDGKHVLLAYDHSSQLDFIVVNLDAPSESINLDRAFGVDFEMAALTNNGRFAAVAANDGSVYEASITAQSLPSSVVGGVTDVLYEDGTTYAVVDTAAGAEIIDLRTPTQPLIEVDQSLAGVEISEYEGKTNIILRTVDDQIRVYVDPQVASDAAAPVVDKLLQLDSIRAVTASPEGRFVALTSELRTHVYDLETLQTYKVELGTDEALMWLDGHRFTYSTDGQLHVVDFNGENAYQIASSDFGTPAFIDEDYRAIYSINTSSRTNQVFLRASSLETN